MMCEYILYTSVQTQSFAGLIVKVIGEDVRFPIYEDGGCFVVDSRAVTSVTVQLALQRVCVDTALQTNTRPLLYIT